MDGWMDGWMDGPNMDELMSSVIEYENCYKATHQSNQ